MDRNPGAADTYDLYGRMLASLERYDESVAMLERARELDPLAHKTDVATTLVRAGRYEEAIQSMVPVVELDPAHSRARATLGWAYLLTGRHPEGVTELERAVAAAPGETVWLAQLGEAYGMTGNETAARDVLARLHALSREEYVSPYHLAYVHTGLGEADAALDLLERAVDERAGAVYGLKGSFLFAPLRSHPRFARLLARMNLGAGATPVRARGPAA
jgi:tetratricopeptide (TPR) repeat protein